MHLLTIPKSITEPIPIVYGRPLNPGSTYLCANAFAGNMLSSRWSVIVNDEPWSLNMLLQVTPFEERPFIYTKDIFIIRGGGYGDLLLLTPLAREIRKRQPECTIHVVCGGQYHDVFNGTDIIAELSPLPIEDSLYNCVVCYDEWIEGHPKAREVHMVQHFAQKCGITLTDLKPEYHISQEEDEWATTTYPRNSLPRIGVQFLASALIRTYPKIEIVVNQLAKKAEVFLFGLPGQLELVQPIPNVINLTAQKLTFRQSAAVLNTCDACVAPDSVMVHVCSALDIPCLGLYAPFPSELRATSPLLRALNGRAVPCAPCFFHALRANSFPHNMPCTEAGYCVAFDSITPEKVVEEALALTSLGPAREIPALAILPFKLDGVQDQVPL
jgi:ADP-heptose:LPS heptosyltransferase